MAIYLEVDNLEALWNGVKINSRASNSRPLFGQPYGMREIHVIIPRDPDTYVYRAGD
jgi:hypothetical protein